LIGQGFTFTAGQRAAIFEDRLLVMTDYSPPLS
jgi:hypothetical protein